MAQALDTGVFLHSFARSLEEAIKVASQNGLNIAQLGPVADKYLTGDGVEANRSELVELLRDNNVRVGLLCVCYEHGTNKTGGAESYTNIDDIAKTGGYGYEGPDAEKIVAERMQLTKEHIDLGKYLQEQGMISSDRIILTTHVGFFHRLEKREQIKTVVKEVVQYCHEQDAYFAIETGSEDMRELIIFIKEVEAETGIEGRLGVNYDPANFLLYGTQYPLEALNVLKEEDNAKYLFGVHVKDATGEIVGKAEGNWKGADVPVGTGYVKWKETVSTLYGLGYKGPLVIERESQPDDLLKGVMIAPEEMESRKKALIADSRLQDIKIARDYIIETQQEVL